MYSASGGFKIMFPDLAADFVSLDEWLAWYRHDQNTSLRNSLEAAIMASWQSNLAATHRLAGYCDACERVSTFLLDRDFSVASTGEWLPNWRERLVCDGCGLNNRSRAIVSMVSTLLGADARIWLQEQLSPLHHVLESRYRNLVGSEYLGEGLRPGIVDGLGRRHEDARASSFSSGELDAIVSLDVLEHVPDYQLAFAESARVLRPGGMFIWTAPFALGSESTIVRAVRRSDGSVQHLLPPEYHGDPLNSSEGILCFQHFGWDVLSTLRSLGFASAQVQLMWSHERCNLGEPQVIVVSRTG